MKLEVNTLSKYMVVDINSVKKNDWNPNVIDSDSFDALKNNLDLNEGNYQQPILVRTHSEGWYEIIDWEKRWMAMNALGFKEVVITIEELSDVEARLKTIAMNRIRGEFDTIELAKLVRQLKEDYGVTEEMLKEFAGYSHEEIASLESFLDFDASKFIKIKEEEAVDDFWEENIIEELETVTIVLSKKQQEMLDEYIGLINKEEAYWIIWALVHLSEEIDSGVLDKPTVKRILESQK